MADENKTVILGIELDVSELVASSAQARAEIQKLKDANKELAKAEGDNAIAIEQNIAKTKELQQQLRNNEKQIAAVTEVNKKNTGSINDMRAQLSAATISYNNLSKEQRDNSNVGVKLKEDIKKLSDELKANESAIGDNRRNVGNYAEAMKSLPGPLAQAGQGVDELKSAFAKLLANPILLTIAAIVLALKGLKEAFTSTDSGALEFEVRMGQLKSILNTAKERAFDFGNAVISLFKGDTEEAARKFGDALGFTSVSFADAAAAARKYAEALDDIEDTEKAYIARSAVNQKKIAEFEFNAADKSYTIEQRESFLLQAIALDRQETEEHVKQANKRLEAEANALAVKTGIRAKDLQSFVALTEEERKKTDKALLDKYDKYHEEFEALTGFYAKSINAQTEFFENEKKNNAKVTDLRDKNIAEQKEKHDKAVADYEKAEQKKFEATQNRLKEEKKSIELSIQEDAGNAAKVFQDKLANLQKDREIELSQKNLTAGMKLNIERQYQLAVKQLGADAIKAQEDLAKKSLENQIKSNAEAAAVAKAQNTLDFLAKKQALDELHNEGLITEQQYIKQLEDLRFEAAQRQLQTDLANIEAQISIAADGSAQKLQLEADYQAKKQALAESTTKRAEDLSKKEMAQDLKKAQFATQVAGQAFGQIASMYDQGSDEYKAFASAQVIASGIQAVMAAFASANASPENILFPGYPYVIAATTAAFAALQVAKINDVQFYDGGYTGYGNPRSESTAVGRRPYTYHKQEYIVPHQVLQTPEGSMHVAFLESLRTKNNSGIPGFFDGGFANRSISAPVENRIDLSGIQNALSNMPTPIVLVEDINSAQGTKARVESRASI